MLIRFRVKNFLSFNELQEFNMISGKVRNKQDHLDKDENLKVLKFAAIYGANASGKSNLIKAIEFIKNMVENTVDKNHTIREPLLSKKGLYCKINEKNAKEASYFEVELKINGKYFAYGFEMIISEDRIVSEWLYELLPTGKQNEIFSREIEKGGAKISYKNYFKSSKLLKKLDVYASEVKDADNILFLTEMNRNKNNLYKEEEEAKVLRDVYEWFARAVSISYPGSPVSNYSYFETSEKATQIEEVIASFGTGIEKYKIVPSDLEAISNSMVRELLIKIIEKLEADFLKESKENKDLESTNAVVGMGNKIFMLSVAREESEIKREIKTVVFKHKNCDALFSLEEESDGTRRLLDLLEILFSDSKSEQVYIIDELDRSLHPQLSYQFVKVFLESIKDKKIQLITTTHESHLMDFDLLRRDEIWFVNKESGGESKLYSLDQFNDRLDKKIDKAYLEGRYKGIPVFSTVYPVQEV